LFQILGLRNGQVARSIAVEGHRVIATTKLDTVLDLKRLFIFPAWARWSSGKTRESERADVPADEKDAANLPFKRLPIASPIFDMADHLLLGFKLRQSKVGRVAAIFLPALLAAIRELFLEL